MKTLAIYGEDGAAVAEMAKHAESKCHVVICKNISQFLSVQADFHLSFDEISDPGIIKTEGLLHHSPAKKLSGENKVARFCAWNTFWQRNLWDVAVASPAQEYWVVELLQLVERKPIFVEDRIGLVSPRVLACLINEAGLALRDGICSPEDLDTAMQLGTGYPLGLLEWAKRIGHKEISQLMEALSEENNRYSEHANWT